MHLGSSLLDYFSLLSDTKTFKVIKTYTKFLVHIAWLETGSIHMESSFIMIPEYLMWLIFHW